MAEGQAGLGRQGRILKFIFTRCPTLYQENSQAEHCLQTPVSTGGLTGVDPGTEQHRFECYQITNRGMEELCKPRFWTRIWIVRAISKVLFKIGDWLPDGRQEQHATFVARHLMEISKRRRFDPLGKEEILRSLKTLP